MMMRTLAFMPGLGPRTPLRLTVTGNVTTPSLSVPARAAKTHHAGECLAAERVDAHGRPQPGLHACDVELAQVDAHREPFRGS